MRYKGRPVANKNIRYIVIPRSDGDIAFYAKPLLSFSGFEEVCPEPKPQYVQYPGADSAEPDYTDEKYLAAKQEHNRAKVFWVYLTSLADTPGLEWDTIDMADWRTYKNFDKELRESGFTEYEIGRIIEGINIVNGLDEEQMEKSREAFLASIQASDKE